MRANSQIRRTLTAPEAVEKIVGILASERLPSRSALGRRVCSEFGFQNQRGRWQLAGGLKALRVPEQWSERSAQPVPAGTVRRGGQPALLAAGVQLAAAVSHLLGRVLRRWRERLGVPRAEHAPRQEPGQGLGSA